MSIVDAAEREAALDPRQSFCISAPAGSGKTELLIQRFLSLLARVQRPEQILAITFTRKAAAEMRERVLEALQEARADTPCHSPHQQRTRELARAALAADRERDWQLLGNSARLNIRTIDGFCAALTRQMPVLSQFGAQAAAVDDPAPLYAEAVAELFAMLESSHPVAADLRALMLHFDNHWDKLAELLQGLLSRRDQWLTYTGVHQSPEAAEAQLLRTLHTVIREILQRLRARLGPYLGELYELQCFAAESLGEAAPDAAPGAGVEDLPVWRSLRHLLLTRGGDWRGRLTKREGFPPGKGRAQAMKQRMMDLLAELSGDPVLREGLREDLLEVDVLPELEADTTSWRLVLQLSHILPVLAAQLLLVFQRRGAVDHSQVAQSALRALGDDEAPTDLALRLDYRIEHILVDEFQDTAINQFELVRRLTRGWGEHNEANAQTPRTFLIVGDGMQSIYGFRDANVGLFLQARDRGFNGVVPRYLELRSNFRSEAGVVDWVNRTFGQVFPVADDISRGEVSFSAAAAVKDAAAQEAVTVTVFHGEGAARAEVDHVCDGVADALAADPETSVAVLGRSRPQLQAIVAGLRARSIVFAAQDMDRLQFSPVVLDLVTLARALANPADRVAWLALLRAPWCGLTLADLHALSRPGPYCDLLELAGDSAVLEGLTPDGRARLAHVRAALAWAHSRRDRLSQRAWLEQAWLRLGGPATAPGESALADAERFFQLIEQGEQEGRILDIPWLQAQLERLYADAGGAGARVQVMTLHKAKGLEFDCVFIPSLARGAGQDRRPLLLWDEVSAAGGEGGFLLAADDHSAPGEPGLYNFLGRQRKRKQALESTRLLYVGATRAIRRLALSATLATDERSGEPKPPGGNTLLACIWPAVSERAVVVEASPVAASEAAATTAPLRRLATLPAARDEGAWSGPAAGNIPAAGDNRLERHVGTAVHQVLEMLATGETLPAVPGELERDSCRWALASLGLYGEALERALAAAMESLVHTLADAEIGRWLLRPDHPEAACELPLTRLDGQGQPRDIVIDRTFIDAGSGVRWIVDYKTSRPPPEVELETFLEAEGLRYREQLAGYREALATLGPEPVRCALYFTALGRWYPL